MNTSFRDWLKIRESDQGSDSNDLVAAWRAMRANTAGLGDTPRTTSGAQRSVEIEAPVNKPQTKLPNQIVDALQSGFKMGGPVPDNLVRYLQLSGINHHFAAESILHARGHAYPFYREKRAGQYTGKFMFVQHFPIDKFLRMVG